MMELTDSLIQESFSKLGLDEIFFQRYESEVRKCYTELQDSEPDDDDTPYEESNVAWSLQSSAKYIGIYAKELEKGHGEKWADSYARNITIESDYITIRIAMEAIENKDELERELEIHANSLSKDAVYKRRYKSLLQEGNDKAKEIAEEYTNIYHSCIDEGKSETYAHAYAYATNNFSEPFWEIYANSYEEAVKHGMNDLEAAAFGYMCTDSADGGFFSGVNDFKKIYKEDWQRDFYIQLIRDDFKKYDKKILTEEEIDDLRKMIYH